MGHEHVYMHKTYKCPYVCPPGLGKAGCCAAGDDTTPHDTSHHPTQQVIVEASRGSLHKEALEINQGSLSVWSEGEGEQ